MDKAYCADHEHHFVELKHFTGGSECHCCKCGLVCRFNRGCPERIEPKDMAEFLKKYQGSKRFVGLQVINYIKTWFIEEDNKTGCRFLVVDAYNQEKVLKFYERNHFKYLYVNEREERVALHIPENEEELYTRLMFLDLMYTEIMESPF